VDGDGGSRTHKFLVASEALCHQSFVPLLMRTDGVEPPQREAPRLQRGELSNAQRPQERTVWLDQTAAGTTTTPPMPASPASATQRQMDMASNAGKSSWLAKRAGFSGGEGRPSGFEPEPRGSRPRVLPLHHDHHAADAGFAGAAHHDLGSKPRRRAGKSSWPAKRAGFSGVKRGRPDSNRRVLA
jgi:hypothetical protein